MTKQVFIIRPDTLSSKDKEKLTKNGYIVIEHPNPEEVKIITETSAANANDIMLSALYAINQICPKESFAKNLSKRMGALDSVAVSNPEQS